MSTRLLAHLRRWWDHGPTEDLPDSFTVNIQCTRTEGRWTVGGGIKAPFLYQGFSGGGALDKPLSRVFYDVTKGLIQQLREWERNPHVINYFAEDDYLLALADEAARPLSETMAKHVAILREMNADESILRLADAAVARQLEIEAKHAPTD